MARVTRRDFLKGGVGVAAAGVGAGLLPRWSRAADAPPAAPLRQPNFLFITTDQQRYDTLRSYGCRVAKTPNIDQLAAEGVRFERCFTSNPVCMPARASWFTGQYPSRHGVWQNGVPLNPQADTLQVRLRQAGYHAAVIGKLHLDNIVERKTKHPAYGFDLLLDAQGDPYYKDDYFQWLDRHGLYDDYLQQFRKGGHRRGYTRDIDEDRHMNNWVTGHAEKYLEDRASDGRPFFLSVAYFDPHHPFDPCEPYASLFDPADMPMPLYRDGETNRMTPPAKGMVRDDCRDAAVIRKTIAAYHAKIAHVDAMVGRIMARLRRAGLEENTVVVFTSDHGEMLGDHSLLLKGPLFYEGAIHLPLIWRFPSRFGVRGTDAGFASHIDFAPTVAALAGIPGPSGMPGAALFDKRLARRPVPARDHAIVEWCDRPPMTNGSFQVARCIVTDRWKCVAYRGEPFGELYDRVNDPQEFENRWGSAESAAVKGELCARLWQGEVDAEPRPQRTKDF